MSDALGFELPSALMEPTVTTNPLPFDVASEESQPEPAEVAAVATADETVH